MHVGAGTAQTQTMIDAARSAGVNRVVLLSSIGARLIPLAGFIPGTLAAREDLLRESDWTLPICDRTALCRMHCRGSMASARRTASLTRPTRVASQLSIPYDIARIAALALTERRHVGHGYILNGPEALTAREQVGIISMS